MRAGQVLAACASLITDRRDIWIAPGGFLPAPSNGPRIITLGLQCLLDFGLNLAHFLVSFGTFVYTAGHRGFDAVHRAAASLHCYVFCFMIPSSALVRLFRLESFVASHSC